MPTQNKPICGQVNINCNQFKCKRKKRSEKNYPYAKYTQTTRTINCDKL